VLNLTCAVARVCEVKGHIRHGDLPSASCLEWSVTS